MDPRRIEYADYGELEFLHVEDFYDIEIQGLCRHEGDLKQFIWLRIYPESSRIEYLVYKLRWYEKLWWLAKMKYCKWRYGDGSG